jgi:hypothetical protein
MEVNGCQKGMTIRDTKFLSAPYLRHEKGLLRPDKKPGFQTPSGNNDSKT